MLCIKSLIKEKGKRGKREYDREHQLAFQKHPLVLCRSIIESECFKYVIKIVYEKLHAL